MGYIKNKSNESKEDYLETILQLRKEKGSLRAIDIANKLNFSKASVSIAMKALKEKGYITVTHSGLIDLTENGLKIAEEVLERHELLSSWLISLGVDEKTAINDACRIEHDISKETFEKLKEHCLKRTD